MQEIKADKVSFSGGYNVPLQANPFSGDMKILDCGDIPVTSYVIKPNNKDMSKSTTFF